MANQPSGQLPALLFILSGPAGSGKTTVLTKRVEFLVKNHLDDPKKILAITFTRKARQEMIKRLSKAENLDQVMVETFNSFCEKTGKRRFWRGLSC